MTKKIIILAVSLLSLVSCKKNIFVNKYEGLIPYIEVEKTTLEVFEDIDVKEYILKLNDKESFICFFYSSTCNYCNKLINNIINPYVKDTQNAVYGLDVYKDSNYQLLEDILKYQPQNNDYFHIENSIISISRPVIQIIDEGVIIDYEKGYSINSKRIIESYIK